jgi:amino acid adenylation domain-containing protein
MKPLTHSAIQSEAFPLSVQQKRILYIARLNPDTPLWNKVSCNKFNGKVDLDRLLAAVYNLPLRHPVLRTRILYEPGGFIQSISNPDNFKQTTWLSNLSAQPIPKDQALDTLNKYYLQPIDLVAGPLFGVNLFRTDDESIVVVLKLHHIISDAHTFQLLWRDLINHYNHGATSGTDSNEGSLTYCDYCNWQQSGFFDDSDTYWASWIKHGIPLLNLPSCPKDSGTICFSGASRTRDVPSALGLFLKRRALQQRKIPYHYFLTAFVLLLSRICTQKDIVVGGVFGGRHYHSELKSLAGCFVNTVLYKFNLSENSSFNDLIKQVEEVFKTTYTHQEVSLEKMVANSNSERRGMRNPLFRVMFNMINLFDEALTLKGTKKKTIEPTIEATQVDLLLNVEQNKDNFRLNLEYNSDIFKSSIIDEFLEQYLAVLSDYQASPIQMQNSISAANKTSYSSSATCTADTLHELLTLQSQKTPNNVALVYEDLRLSYQQLEIQSTKLAAIVRRDTQAGRSVIGIVTQRSAEMLIGIFAILKAGHAYLPLDPFSPENRIRYVLKDSNAELLLFHEPTRNIAEEIGNNQEIRTLSIEEALLEAHPDIALPKTAPGDLAYVIYTSGSTGNPKGVMIEHRMALNTLNFMHSEYPLHQSDAYLLKTAYTFDVSITELFGWCFDGGHLVISIRNTEKDPRKILEYIEKNAITHINFVPSMLRSFLYVLKRNEIKVSNSLRYVFSAGEALEKDIADSFHQLLPGVSLENLYGPTEASIYATRFSVKPDEKRILIGHPVTNMTAMILDENLNTLPDGIAGELCISGPGVARGYINNEKLTTEKFIVSTENETGTLYRTGDMAVMYRNGSIDYLGRLDEQVKIRGYRIELREISSKLISHPYIREAVSKTFKLSNADHIAVFYIADKNTHPKSLELREFLKSWLPEYMIPTYLVEMEELPLNSSGKVDKKALPTPESDVVLSSKDTSDDIGQSILQIVEDLVGRKDISLEDSFFDIGGTSLVLIEFISQVEEKFGVSLSVLEFIDMPVIGKISDRVSATAGLTVNAV